MVSENVNNFADDAPFIHLANVENIEAEGLHEWGIRKHSGRCSSSTLNLHFSKI